VCDKDTNVYEFIYVEGYIQQMFWSGSRTWLLEFLTDLPEFMEQKSAEFENRSRLASSIIDPDHRALYNLPEA